MNKLLEAQTEDEFAQSLLNGDDTRHPRTARMADRAKPFISRLVDESARDALLEAALTFAWANRHTFNAQYESPEMYWTRSLKAAALTRDKWLIWSAIVPGAFQKKWVLAARLGDHY